MGGGVHGGPHVLRYVIDFRSAMLCIKIGYRVYKKSRRALPNWEQLIVNYV